MTAGTDKIKVIKGSLRCFRYGLASLVPLIGVAFATWAIICCMRVAKEARGQWNPARPYLRWGVGLAVLGVLFSLCLVRLTMSEIAGE